MPFDERRTEQFERDLANHKSLERRIERRMVGILQAPYERSHLLGLGKWQDLTGKRGAHFGGGRMAFILAICEECVQNGWQEKNLPWCHDVCKKQPLERVIWIAFGTHDEAYGRK